MLSSKASYTGTAVNRKNVGKFKADTTKSTNTILTTAYANDKRNENE